jgi:hypothetical protein
MKELELGKRYKGIGSSGMTDGDQVEGILTEIVGTHWYVILTDKGRDYAAHYDSLKEIDSQTQNKRG